MTKDNIADQPTEKLVHVMEVSPASNQRLPLTAESSQFAVMLGQALAQRWRLECQYNNADDDYEEACQSVAK